MAKNGLAVKDKADVPAFMDESFFGGDTGFEGAGKEDFAIPFLSILQALSPQCTDGDPKYIEDAKAGMFYNSVDNAVMSGKDGIKFVPCFYRRIGTLWVPRNEGGGFRGVVPLTELDARLAECDADFITPDGLQLNDTREWYGLIINADGSITPVLLSLTSTGIKVSKRWLSMASSIKINGHPLKLWAQSYTLTTQLKKNDKGSWYILDFKYDGPVATQELFEAAQAFREAVMAGDQKVDYDKATGDSGSEPFNDQF